LPAVAPGTELSVHILQVESRLARICFEMQNQGGPADKFSPANLTGTAEVLRLMKVRAAMHTQIVRTVEQSSTGSAVYIRMVALRMDVDRGRVFEPFAALFTLFMILAIVSKELSDEGVAPLAGQMSLRVTQMALLGVLRYEVPATRGAIVVSS